MAGLRGWPIQRDGSQNGSTPKSVRRGALLGLLGYKSAAVPTGVMLDGTMTPVAEGTGNMSYNIRAAAFVSKYSDANGPTIFANDAPVNVTTTAAPGTNQRRDLVWARQNLVAADGGSGTVNTVEFGVVQGAVASSPTTPSAPAGAVAIGYFTVTANATQTSGLTYTRVHEWLPAAGGIVPDGPGAFLGKVWNGERLANVPLGLIIAGASDAVRAGAFLQVGVAQPATTDANGFTVVNFPQEFPNNLLGFVALDASDAATYGPVIYRWRPELSAKAYAAVRIYGGGNGASVPNMNPRLAWVAWGN